MIHTLLMILKIIGILLLVILAIILSLLLIVLFVPIRYRVNGQKEEADMTARGRVSWLFGLIAFVMIYQEKALTFQVKILGINIMKQSKNKKMDKVRNLEDTKEEKKASAQDAKVQKTASKDLTVQETTIQKETVEDRTEQDTKKESAPKEKKKCNRITEGFSKIKLTITNICDKITYWKKFLTNERTVAAFHAVKKLLWKIIKHILPNKIRGQIVFGFEDPCTTGQILAGISVIYPMYYKQLSINPDFSRQVLNGKLDLKGRIYLGYLLKCVLALILNNNIHYIIHTFRNKEES